MEPMRPAPPTPATPATASYATRALTLWPRLDRRALTRCAEDPVRIARLVARRTNLPLEAIRAILEPRVSDVDRELWFG